MTRQLTKWLQKARRRDAFGAKRDTTVQRLSRRSMRGSPILAERGARDGRLRTSG